MASKRRAVFAINWMEVEALVNARHDNPHHILGIHECLDDVYVNAFIPGAKVVTVIDKKDKKRYSLISERYEGFFSICIKDKKSFDKQTALKKIKRGWRQNLFATSREWPYKYVKHRIIAEKYMEDSVTKELRDYKFFCFNGEVKALFIGTERQKQGEDVKFDFFDADFNHLCLRQGHDSAKKCPEKPQSFEQMKSFASILSKGMPHVRVDLYEVNGNVFFGEMTFYHFGGMVRFKPEEWDMIFGKWLVL